MHLIPAQTRFIKRFIFLFIAYSVLRIGFFLYHLDTYKHFTQDELFESFLLGLRFDVAAICLLNVPIVLLSLVPSKNSKFVFFERLFFIVLNSAAIIASIDDYELFLFMGKRLSFDLFVITDDIWDQLPQLAAYYWYFPLIGVLFGIGFYFFDRKFFKLKDDQSKKWMKIVSGLCLLALTFIGIRGGLQHKSINVQTAFVQGKNELGHLVLNTPYHFLRTLKNKSVEEIKYFKSDDEAINVIMNQRDFRPTKNGPNKKNVVLIIMESFSMEYMEQGYMPFLDELKKQSMFFPYHLANGRRSIEALPSLLCGLPALLDEPISKSMFQGNKFVCMPDILKKAGYTNYFFHGGAKGTMGFESYTRSHGFDRYFSKEDFPKATGFDGTWGIFDGPFLEFTSEELTKMKRPFMAGIFTLSSHQPYAIPEEMKGKFPKGTLEIHESIGYADDSLRKFFGLIKNEPWFNETIFFITGDHTSKQETKKFRNMVGKYRVPLLIFDPSNPSGSVELKVAQHSDIPKTILDGVGIASEELPATAVSLFSSDKGVALNYADGRDYYLVTDKQVLTISKGQAQKLYEYDWEAGRLTHVGTSEDKLLKAYLQYFMNGLINNNLSFYR